MTKFDKNKLHYVVATGIVIKNGKYLIAKRSEKEKAFPGRWTVPGGKLEAEDYIKREKDAGELWYYVLEDLLKREIEEEVGLKIKNIRYLLSLAYIRSDGFPTLIISLYVDWASGKVKLNEDLTEYKWVTLKEAKKYDLIEGIYDELKMTDRVLKGKKASWRGKSE
ncbi:Nucleoside triphosphatase NudI [subsurface metagenome]